MATTTRSAAPRSRVALRLAHARRPAAEDHGHEVGEGPEEDLCREADGKWHRDPVPALAGGCPVGSSGEQHREPRDRDDEPAGRREHGPRGIRLRWLGAGSDEERTEGPEGSAEVGDHAQRGEGERPRGRRRAHHREAEDEYGERAPGGALGTVGDAGPQDGGPQGQDRADDGEPHPAEHVDGEVRDEQAAVDRIGWLSCQESPEDGSDREHERGTHVVVDRRAEASGQGASHEAK